MQVWVSFWWCWCMNAAHKLVLQYYHWIKLQSILVGVLPFIPYLDITCIQDGKAVGQLVSISICHRVLPTLSNATYGKRVEKGVENCSSCRNWGFGPKSLANKSHLLLNLLFIFLIVDHNSSWLRPLKGLASHWSLSKALTQVVNHTFSKCKWWLAIRDCKCLSARLPGKLSHSCEDLLSISLHPTYPRSFGTVTDPWDHTSLMSLEKWMLSWCNCWFSDLNDCSKVLT